jgi:hypothetical protein
VADGFLAGWRSARRLQRAATSYVAGLLAEPSTDDVAWLAACATADDDDRARWELRYLRRAIGLLVAEHESVSDRTAQAVAHVLGDALDSDQHVGKGMTGLVERQFNARLRYYADALASRADATPVAERLGRALLLTAGAMRVPDEDRQRAADVAARYLDEASEQLRTAFGVAALPDDVPPSAAHLSGA